MIIRARVAVVVLSDSYSSAAYTAFIANLIRRLKVAVFKDCCLGFFHNTVEFV